LLERYADLFSFHPSLLTMFAIASVKLSIDGAAMAKTDVRFGRTKTYR
jgi:hypothetical protein